MNAAKLVPAYGLKAKVLALGAVVILAVGGLWLYNNSREPDRGVQPGPPPPNALAALYPYTVAKPGPGDIAPPIQLTTTQGAAFDLGTLRGKTVLLYFQEGVMCQACWDQLKEIEAKFASFRLLGIDELLTITTDFSDILARKARDERLTMPVAADPSVAVSRSYHANGGGMMGDRYDVHSLVIVGPDGRILWRADYGGAPAYSMYVHSMYVPTSVLLADMMQGLTVAHGKETP
jgi:peroxiredoxin Q/BCP